MSSPVLTWLIIGSLFCLMELIFPTAFVEFMMGLSAFIVAGISLFFPYNNALIVIWMLLSFGLILLAKKYFSPKKNDPLLLEEDEAVTITAIAPGEVGRVMYEGNSWQAVCADETIELNPDQKVYIVSRHGNTLSVLPRQF
ncbi:NfeD family protein [Cyanobacterium stanieri LEGE 03274]|uniref:NfeD family protein n=1 Tax=Cyanobacterium stanieri LEGE 03274 TaxID=1828756 RepID=A0ABR9V5D8_9CHRO|nr:NfeD family protein [Cyanobacterium stanieri]MBE9222759.1 NfeD family protein [Cyanobacterium stanieri LEGE 03274]